MGRCVENKIIETERMRERWFWGGGQADGRGKKNKKT